MSVALGRAVRITKVMAAQAAGTSEVNGSSIDMSGWEGVIFIAHFGAITAAGVQSLSADQGPTATPTDALLGSKVVVEDDDDDKVAVLDIWKPTQRFLRPVVARATQNSVVNSVIAIQYSGQKAPPAVGATEVAAGRKFLQSPAEGTP